MAKQPEAKPEGNGAQQQPQINVLVQYTKDFSFENPNAPVSLQNGGKNPNISINVNVNANPLSATDYDVHLSLAAKAETEAGGKVLFNIELIYGGVFRLTGIPQEHVLPVLFIECPRLLFPFARQIISDATRNGGFPPLLLEPIDFATMFQQKMAEEQIKAQTQATKS